MMHHSRPRSVSTCNGACFADALATLEPLPVQGGRQVRSSIQTPTVARAPLVLAPRDLGRQANGSRSRRAANLMCTLQPHAALAIPRNCRPAWQGLSVPTNIDLHAHHKRQARRRKQSDGDQLMTLKGRQAGTDGGAHALLPLHRMSTHLIFGQMGLPFRLPLFRPLALLMAT